MPNVVGDTSLHLVVSPDTRGWVVLVFQKRTKEKKSNAPIYEKSVILWKWQQFLQFSDSDGILVQFTVHMVGTTEKTRKSQQKTKYLEK